LGADLFPLSGRTKYANAAWQELLLVHCKDDLLQDKIRTVNGVRLRYEWVNTTIFELLEASANLEEEHGHQAKHDRPDDRAQLGLSEERQPALLAEER